jgi:hypothetical protein
MPEVATLKQFQNSVVAAVRSGEFDNSPWFSGRGTCDVSQWAIHRRNYQSTLIAVMMRRFAATAWLVGSELVHDMVLRYIVNCPPKSPCLNEYGESFPDALKTHVSQTGLSYVGEFARLDFSVGSVANEVDFPVVDLSSWAVADPERLADSSVHLQPGVRYLASSWPIDKLMSSYLSESTKAPHCLEPETVLLQVRGCRGAIVLSRLNPFDYWFRRVLAAGASISEAATRAFAEEPSGDLRQSILDLHSEALIIERNQAPRHFGTS